MNRHVLAKPLFPLMVIAALIAPASAQQPKPKSGKAATEADLANAKPGRDPNQPIDEEYTAGIKKYTTETFFLSPLALQSCPIMETTRETRINLPGPVAVGDPGHCSDKPSRYR